MLNVDAKQQATHAVMAELADTHGSGTCAEVGFNSSKPVLLCGFIGNAVSSSLL